MIECYVSACPHHSWHAPGEDVGPFCSHEECLVTPAYIEAVESYRPDEVGLADIENKKTGIYHPDVIAREEALKPIREKLNPTPKLWQCRVAIPVVHVTDSTASLVYTIYVNAPTLQEAWHVLTNIHGEDREIRSIKITRALHQIIS